MRHYGTLAAARKRCSQCPAVAAGHRLDFAPMRGRLLLGTCAAALGVALTIAAPVIARSRTTNAPAIFTVKVTLTDSKVAMLPNHAVRGSTVTFILTNRGKKRHTFVLGQAQRVGTQGFVRTLGPNQQSTVVMYLDFRGVLKYTLRRPKSTTSIARGGFRVT